LHKNIFTKIMQPETFDRRQEKNGGGANEVIALSLRGGFIAETISLRVEGIASVAIAPSQ
jgi:hypothetical protein